MLIQTQPNSWSCFPTAFAMVLDMDVQDLIAQIGHNGSAILWPSLPYPLCCKGWHYQEIIKACLELGKLVSHFEREVESAPGPNVEPHTIYTDLGEYTFNTKGVVGITSHALAYDNNKFYNPATGLQTSKPSVINHIWIIESRIHCH